MVIISLIFSDKIKEQAKEMIDSSIDGTFEFKDANVSFFSHFPTLAITMSDVALYDVSGFEKGSLFSGKELSLGVNFFSIFSNNIKIRKIYIEGGNLLFHDKVSNFSIELNNLDYKGTGNITGENLSLRSRVEAESLMLSYEGVNYIDRKRVKAKLFTNMNTAGMNFKLIKNDVKIEDLSASFSGELDILEDGYSVNLNLITKKASFKNILSLLPRAYAHWLANTDVQGDAKANVTFSGKTKKGTTLSPDLTVSFDIYNGKIMSKDALVPVQNIRLSSSITLPSLYIEKLVFTTDTLSFNVAGGENIIALQIKGISTPVINIEGKGNLNLDTLSRALGLSSYYASGAMRYNLIAQGLLDDVNGKIPNCDINIELENGSIATPFVSEKIEEINTQLSIKNSSGTLAGLKVKFHPIAFKFAGSPFYLDCDLENFEDLNYAITSKGSLDLDSLALLFGIENSKIKGKLDVNLNVNGNKANTEVQNIAQANGSGSLTLSKFEFSSASYPYPFLIPKSEFVFEQDMAILKNTTIQYGSNSITVFGYASNFINFFITKGELSGALDIISDKVNLKDFTSIMFDNSDSELASSISDSSVVSKQCSSVIFVPHNMNLSLSTNIKQIVYESIKAKNFKGEVAIAKGAFFMNGTGVNIAGAQFLLDAIYKPIDRTKANLEFHARADSFDIARAYREIPIVRELFSTASSLEGLVSMDYSISTTLDSLMAPIYPSVKGKGFIRLEDVNVKGLKILGTVSRATGKDSLNNPNLKAVLINTSIKNNIVTIERTKMRVFGFRPRFEGQTTLDGRLNIKMRLGLPPLGIIGIPITITGTYDNPNVQIRRGKNGDILYEEEYTPNNN